MAKRRRLSPANPDAFEVAPETKTGLTPTLGSTMTRAPIADVASEAAATAVLGEVSRELTLARNEGRMVLVLELDQIVLDHLVRDRLIQDEDELNTLIESIAQRGQQAPIEVMELEDGRFGLISGWRRCQALLHLTNVGCHNGTVLALLRRPADASDAYQAMVEENEIRVGLSYFERARIAAKAVEQGVFETEKAALLTLFGAASRAKRSKIRSFLPLVHALDGVLSYPHQIGERLGLRLGAALERDPAFGVRLREVLIDADAQSAEVENAILVRELAPLAETETQSQNPRLDPDPNTRTETNTGGSPQMSRATQQVRPGLKAAWKQGGDELILSGPDMTDDFRARLIAWLRQSR